MFLLAVSGEIVHCHTFK